MELRTCSTLSVRRNGYGRQIASFETELNVKGVGEVPGVFIRAPRIETWSEDVEVLAMHDHGDGEHPVLVRQGARLGLLVPSRALERRPRCTGSSSKRFNLDTIDRAHRGRRNRCPAIRNGQRPSTARAPKTAARAKVFAKLIRQVEVAAREGGGDLDTNASLRTMFQKAREASVPLDTIERAIKRGTGELEGVRYEAISYEGYGPGGVAVIVETLTDNRNRTSAEIKHVFAQERRHRSPSPARCPGSSTARASSKSRVHVDEDQLLEWVMDAGAENFESNGDELSR